MAESALRQYEYGGEGLFGAFMPSRREIISPEAQIPMGYRQGRRGPEVVLENIPAKYGEPESGFEYTPVVRGIKSALNYIGDAFSDPQQAIESVQTIAPQALAGVDQYMRDQYTAGALGGTTYNPQTGQVTEFNPIDAATMLAPSGFLTRAAATPGSVVLGMVGSKNTKYTPEQLEAIKQLDARGWDTEKLFLHGTASDYDDAFRASQTGDLGPGFYTTGQVFDDAGEISTVMSRSGKMETVPDIASRYANIRKFMRPEQRGSGAPNTRPVVYKKDLNFLDVQGGMVGPVDAERVNALKAQGYDGIRVIDPNTGNVAQTNVFDPDNVRSAFDYSIPDTPAQGQSALNDLDMSYDTRMQRAVDQGYVGPYYHATMDAGDIDEFKPKYRDNLTFVSPTPDFANSWIGKGGARSKAYDEPLYSMMKADKQAARDKYASQYGDEIDNWPQSAQDDYWAEQATISNQYNASGASVMPLMVRAENTFDPAAKTEVLDELIRNQGYDPEGSNIITGLSNRDAFATGNYLFLENPEVVEFLKSKGFDSMLVGESDGRPTNLALFNTSGIRSEYADFDPSKKGSSNILAGIAGAGVVGGSALSGQKQEQKQ